MNKVFEPGVEPPDPSRVIEIQEKIKELLEANQQRREGIKEEISAYGAWALPGLINATYVWMHDMENKQRQAMLAGMMASLARENMPAIDLLFRGVLDTPFEVPRSIARRALEQLDWKPNDKNVQQIEKQIALCRELNDVQSRLDLYALLLRTGNDRELDIALNECKQWVKGSLQPAGDLFALLLQAFPNHAEEILTEVFVAVMPAHSVAYRDETIADMLVNPLPTIPSEWFSNNVLLNASIRVLQRVGTHRHKGIDYLWERAVRDFKQSDPGRWHGQLSVIGAQIQKAWKPTIEDEVQSVYQYWFKALGRVGEIGYIAQETRSQSDLWAGSATLELFFQRNRKAQQTLREIETENPDRYRSAKALYEHMTSTTPTTTETRSVNGPAGLTDKAR